MPEQKSFDNAHKAMAGEVQRLYSTGRASKYLGVCADSVRAYADAGLLKAKELNGRRLFLREELARFIESLPAYPKTDSSVGDREPATGNDFRRPELKGEE